MVRLIMGVKGSGKTKLLIDLINSAAKDEPGNVVCIEANSALTYDIHYHIRLIDVKEYKLNSYESVRGCISGLYAAGEQRSKHARGEQDRQKFSLSHFPFPLFSLRTPVLIYIFSLFLSLQEKSALRKARRAK